MRTSAAMEKKWVRGGGRMDKGCLFLSGSELFQVLGVDLQ